MEIVIKKLGDCKQGDVVQFLDDMVEGQIRKTGGIISLSDAQYNELKRAHVKGIVISKTSKKTRVLEFDSIGSNSFKGLLVLSNMRNSFLVCELQASMSFSPVAV
jgi:hypothetical protein